jgi:hypothetical protein
MAGYIKGVGKKGYEAGWCFFSVEEAEVVVVVVEGGQAPDSKIKFQYALLLNDGNKADFLGASERTFHKFLDGTVSGAKAGAWAPRFLIDCRVNTRCVMASLPFPLASQTRRVCRTWQWHCDSDPA